MPHDNGTLHLLHFNQWLQEQHESAFEASARTRIANVEYLADQNREPEHDAALEAFLQAAQEGLPG